MIKKKIDILFGKVTIIFITTFFVVSFVSHIISFFSIIPPIRSTLIVNLIFELFLFYFLFKIKTKITTHFNILLLITTFFIGQALLGFKFFELNKLTSEVVKGDILQINNYILIFLYVAVFEKVQNKKEIAHSVLDIVKYFVYCNALLVIVGFVFNIELFKSYPHSLRFGFMGLFLANTFAQFIYILLITLAYKKYQVNKKGLLELLFICVVALLLGKKAIVLFLVLLVIYHYCFFHNHKVKFRAITLITLILVIVNKTALINQLVEWFPFWKRFDVNKNLLSVLSSLRDIRFENFMAFVNDNWTKLNYIFGGVNFPKSRVEMAIVDLYMFFGIFGLVIYFNLFRNFFKKIPAKDVILLLFTLIIASLTGSFLVNINLMIIYYLLIYSFEESEDYYYNKPSSLLKKLL